MQNTAIQWTDHTVNFWWGCTKVSRACQHCYAESVAKVFGKRLFGKVPQWGAGKPRFERLEKARAEALKLEKQVLFKYAEILQITRKRVLELQYAENWNWSDRVYLKTGLRPQRPKVFVNSMSDWLDDEVPLEWLAFLLETLAMCPNVDFQLLTKRPENWGVRVLAACLHMAGYRDGEISSKGPTAPEMQGVDAMWEWGKEGKAPHNLWIGTTVEDQKAANTRIPHLLKIPAKVRFLSCEPLVEPVRFIDDPLRNVDGKIVLSACTGLSVIAEHLGSNATSLRVGIHWVIAGGESGGAAEPTHPDWLRSLRDQCAGAGVPFFFKQWGEWLPVTHLRHAAPDTPLNRAYKGHKFNDGTLMLRVGVDTAGALLDGVPHLAFPQ